MTTREPPDYYAVLGVDRSADARTLKDAFRRLTLRYHPDRSREPDATERFKEIAAAYAVLGDPEKRAAYDARGRSAEAYSAEDLVGGVDLGDWLWSAGFGGDWIERMFGARFGAPHGRNAHAEVELDLERIANGGDERVTFTRPASCPACHGSGYRGAEPKGSSRRDAARRRCATCGGSGQIEVSDTVVLHVPAGIDDGTILRLRERGVASVGSRPGDLLVRVRTRPHPRFLREGANLRARIRVEVADAALGTTLRVPTLDAPVELKVPSGTQPGTVLRLRGQGLPRLGSAMRGDLLVTVDVHVPERLSKSDRLAFESMRRPR
jgi:molecular chaperone DnaJ